MTNIENTFFTGFEKNKEFQDDFSEMMIYKKSEKSVGVSELRASSNRRGAITEIDTGDSKKNKLLL